MKNSILIADCTPDDLKEIISKAIKEGLNSFSVAPSTPTKFLTREETANLLRISIPTLTEYTKKGLVKGHRIGSRILYRRDEIEDSLKEIQTIKHRRA